MAAAGEASPSGAAADGEAEGDGLDDDRPFGAPPLTEDESTAKMIAKACQGDWGPVFVYGSMLFPAAWSALIDRLPDMASATLRNYERRCFHTGGFAGIFEREGGSVVGMLVSGLTPKERLLLDAVVDDSFVMREVVVEHTGDSDPRIIVSDCGIAEFNGRYLPDGTVEGRTSYRKDSPSADGKHRTIHFDMGDWHFAVEYKGFFYKSGWGGTLPPTDDWQLDEDGMPPLPTVVREPVTVDCSSYIVRDRCVDAMEDYDWDFETFATEHLAGFIELCKDTQVWREDEKLPDDILKDLAFARRRRASGYEDDEDDEDLNRTGTFRASKQGGGSDHMPDESDPDWIDPRLGLHFVVGIIRLSAIVPPEHLHDRSWAQPVTDPGPSGRTPEEELQYLDDGEKATLARMRKTRGIKYPKEPGPREAGDLIEKLRAGDIKLYGESPEPLVANGLPPTKGADFCVVSAPTVRSDWFARVAIICASFRIGFAAASEVVHEDIWFLVWKRCVDKMIAQQKQLLVLTQVETFGGSKDRPGTGRIDFVQSVQLLHLQRKGCKFYCVDTMEFCRDLQPVLTAAANDDFDTVEQHLMARRSIPVPLANVVDNFGRTAMHYVARMGPSERTIRMLLESGECINAAQWGCDEHGPGWTPLMHAVVFGPHRMVKVLLESNADAHAQNFSKQDVFALASRGPQKNERMLSQCHWRYCLACTQNAEEEPPPDNVVEEGKMTSAQVHAAYCKICSRYM